MSTPTPAAPSAIAMRAEHPSPAEKGMDLISGATKRSVPVSDVAAGGVRLTIPLRAGDSAAEIAIDPGHCERLLRMAAYRTFRDGFLHAGDAVVARLVPGRVRERHGRERHRRENHGDVYCLESCCVELSRAGRAGRPADVVARVEFPREVFAAFVAARATHLLGPRAPDAVDTVPVGYALHAVESVEPPLCVELPVLAPLSVARLAAVAVPSGTPDGEWVATFVTPEVAAGLVEIGRVSRASGVEAAARIHTRVGFDAAQRCFVRILDRFVLSRATQATGMSVVSTAASWGEFLSGLGAGPPGAGPQAPASVHTHVHLDVDAAGTLRATDDPCISIDDVVTHYTTFPDALSAAVIVSVFPDGTNTTVYGYTPQAQLREEPGYWVLSGNPEV